MKIPCFVRHMTYAVTCRARQTTRLCPQHGHHQHRLWKNVSTSQCVNNKEDFQTSTNTTSTDSSGHISSHQSEVPPPHVPVLLSEVLEYFNPQNGQKFLDMTFGAGGHTKAIFERAPECQVFGLDRDPTAHRIAQRYAQENPRFTPLLGRFSEAHHLVSEHGITPGSLDGVLLDVGASSMQFDEAHRGFSISKDGPLDMRMDGGRCPDTPTAADIINTLDEEDLYKIFKRYGEERKPRLVARAIVSSRHTFGRVTRTKQLADIVASVHQMSFGFDKLQRQAHVATRVFQALRIFVNNELNELNNGLEVAYHLLRPGGVCVAIAFHSLEDRIAKRHFHGLDIDMKGNMSITAQHRNNMKTYRREDLEEVMKKRWEPLTRKVVLPSQEEEDANPRSRSAKLRAARKRKSTWRKLIDKLTEKQTGSHR